MALRVFQYSATIPAGTAKASPTTVDFDLDGWDVESIDLEVPPGPNYLMGFYLANNGVQWLPKSPGEWVIWDDRMRNYPLTDQPNASGWALVGYNTGGYDHTVTVAFHVNPPTLAPPAPPVVQVASAPAPSSLVLL